MQGLALKQSPSTTSIKTYSNRIGKLQHLIYQGVPDNAEQHSGEHAPVVTPPSDSESDGGTVLFQERQKLQQDEQQQHLLTEEKVNAFSAKHSYLLSERASSQAGSLNSHQVPLQQMQTHSSDMYNGMDQPVNVEVRTELEKADLQRQDSLDVQPRIDIIADLQAPFARHNLNKLLFRLYQDSSYLRIFVNKWSEWDDFSHKDNPVAPRATFFPGVFQVHLERKLISSYNMYQEQQKANLKKSNNSRNGRTNSSHQNFVEEETRESVETQIEQFNQTKQNRTNNQNATGSTPAGMFEADTDGTSDGEEDPNFNAEEIAFKVRLQCHKDRKKMVKNLVRSGQVHASEPSPEKLRAGELPMPPVPTARPPRRYVTPSEKNSNMNLDKAKETGLVVLKETAEPEEEEDTLEDLKSMRQQLSQQQQSQRLHRQHSDSLYKDEDAGAMDQGSNPEINVEMKVKRRLQRSPKRINPERKIKAINALYGSEASMEYIKAGLGLSTSRRAKAAKRCESVDLVDLVDLPVPSTAHADKDNNDTKLPELPRHLVSQENKEEPTLRGKDLSSSSIIQQRSERRRRGNNSKVRFADMVDDYFVSASVDSRAFDKLSRPEQLQILERNHNLELDASYDYLTPANNRSKMASYQLASEEQQQQQQQRSLPNSCLKKRKDDNKLKILEQNGIMVIRDGQVLNNDQLLDKIRVPEKIQRKFTIARDFVDQTRSCERLSTSKKPFVVPPIQQEEARRKQMTIAGASKKTKKSRSNAPGGRRDDGSELNNVKVTDFQTREMMLLTSQIFDIRAEEMQESKTSEFNRRRTSRQTDETSQSVHLQANQFNLLGSSARADLDDDEASEKGTPDFSRNSSKLPWINAQNRQETSEKPGGVGILKGPHTTRKNMQQLFDHELSKFLQAKQGINKDMEEVDKDKQIAMGTAAKSEIKYNSEVMVESKELSSISQPTVKPSIQKSSIKSMQRPVRRYKSRENDNSAIEIGSKTLKPQQQDKSNALFGLKPNMYDPAIEQALISPVRSTTNQQQQRSRLTSYEDSARTSENEVTLKARYPEGGGNQRPEPRAPHISSSFRSPKPANGHQRQKPVIEVNNQPVGLESSRRRHKAQFGAQSLTTRNLGRN